MSAENRENEGAVANTQSCRMSSSGRKAKAVVVCDDAEASGSGDDGKVDLQKAFEEFRRAKQALRTVAP